MRSWIALVVGLTGCGSTIGGGLDAGGAADGGADAGLSDAGTDAGAPDGGTDAGGPATFEVTINAFGASPNALLVNPGDTVRFTNADSLTHGIESFSDATHAVCPELDVGLIPSGQSVDATIGLGARTCLFRDSLQPATTSLQGSVSVQ